MWIKSEISNIYDHVINKLFEFSILIHLHLFVLDRKWNFEQFKMGFSNELRHEIIDLQEKSGRGVQVKRHAYASRDYLLHIQSWMKMYTPA